MACCLKAAALLFDLDGVLVDSEPAFERQWQRWAALHGVTGEIAHRPPLGLRTIDQVRMAAPNMDAHSAAKHIEAMVAHDPSGAKSYPGVQYLLATLPPDRWAIVTSSTRPLALALLRAAGLTVPNVLVTAESVTHGKPDPEGYIIASARLRVAPSDAVVVEDSPAGIVAGHTAGAFVIAVPTTHAHQQLVEADIIAPLSTVRVQAIPSPATYVTLCLTGSEHG